MDFLCLGLILDEKAYILNCNLNFLKLTGYSLEEVLGKKLCNLLYESACAERFEKLKGEIGDEPLDLELTFRRKEGYPLYFKGKIKRYLREGETHFLIFGQNITLLETYKRLYRLLRKVNSIITKAQTEEELYQDICKVLVDELGLRFVWVGVPDPEKGMIVPQYHYGYGAGYLSKIKISLDPEAPEGKGPTAQAAREGKIIINPDTRTNPFYSAFRTPALERGYLSSVAIPLYVKGELRAFLNLYSQEPYYFNLLQEGLLYELKEDLEFALERIEKEQYLTLVSKAISNSDLWLVITDEKGKILHINTEVVLLTGYTEEELLGQNLTIFEAEKGSHLEMWEVLSESGEFSSLFTYRKKNGEILYIDLKAIPVAFESNKKRVVFIGRDLTLQIELFETIEKLKNFDPLTQSLSLRGFIEKVKTGLNYIKDKAIVVVLDLYQFTYVNDHYGFQVGDNILKTIAQRLKGILKSTDYLARISSDEFCVFISGIKDREEIASYLHEIGKLVSMPIDLGDEKFVPKYNLGIALYPLDGTDPEDLYRKANSACSFAKKEGPNVVKFYGSEVEILIKKTLEVERLIEEALSQGYFQFYFQPYFDVNNFFLAGAEALIRIVKPDGEVISPALFISALESSPLRRDFEIWAVKTLVEKVNLWKIPIGLNLYPDTFEDVTFWEAVSSELERLKSPLVLEITERGFIKNPEGMLEVFNTLKQRFPFIKIALDDFGTGYSNLSYLRKLPLDYLKVDLSFVREVLSDERARGIVKTIIDLAHILQAKALAEGVEYEEQIQILDIMGCDLLQGFYFERPLPEKEFLDKYKI